MCIPIKFNSPFPDFSSLYSQIDFSNIRLPEFKVPTFTLPNPLFPKMNIPAINFNFFVTDIQQFNLLGILNKFLGKMLGFLGMGFDILPKMPVLNISFKTFMSYITGGIDKLYELAYKAKEKLLALFPKDYSGFNIPELEIVNKVRMLIADYTTKIVTFASNIVNMVINKVSKVFKVGLPGFKFPTLPTIESLLELAKKALPTIPEFKLPDIKFPSLKPPTFNFDFSKFDFNKILSLEFLKAKLKIPGFKFPSFPDIDKFFSKVNAPEINIMEKITKLSVELSTFLLKKATDFFNKIVGRFIGALNFAIPTFTIPCPPGFKEVEKTASDIENNIGNTVSSGVVNNSALNNVNNSFNNLTANTA